MSSIRAVPGGFFTPCGVPGNIFITFSAPSGPIVFAVVDGEGVLSIIGPISKTKTQLELRGRSNSASVMFAGVELPAGREQITTHVLSQRYTSVGLGSRGVPIIEDHRHSC